MLLMTVSTAVGKPTHSHLTCCNSKEGGEQYSFYSIFIVAVSDPVKGYHEGQSHTLLQGIVQINTGFEMQTFACLIQNLLDEFKCINKQYHIKLGSYLEDGNIF